MPGIVPKFYEIAACNASNYEFYGSWQDITREQRAELVGHYYSAFMIEGHKSDTVNERIKKDSKKRGQR